MSAYNPVNLTGLWLSLTPPTPQPPTIKSRRGRREKWVGAPPPPPPPPPPPIIRRPNAAADPLAVGAQP